MAQKPDIGVQRIELDGEWGLFEFSGFAKEYGELYSFFYGLQYSVEEEDGIISDGRVYRAFTAYPWKGGWSAVDFFNDIRAAVPKKYRPQVKAIQYASPGFLDLTVVESAAMSVAVVVGAVCFAINRANTTYRNIQKGMRDKKLGDIDVRKAEMHLTRDEIEFIDQSIVDLARLMELKDLETITALNPDKLGTLKILLAVYRRARVLGKLQDKGQIKLPERRRDPGLRP